MPFLIDLAWRDLKAGSRALWVFCACIALGVCLVAATGGLYGLIGDALQRDVRALMGGDVEIDARGPLPEEVLAWLHDHGTVSTVIELDTMLGTPGGDFRRVELQVVDAAYPLYGELELDPVPDLATATGLVRGRWGAALDGDLAGRLGLAVGDEVHIGTLTLTLRALIREQPDRKLRADWRGAPVLVAPGALDASGLVQPASRVEYEYRIRTEAAPDEWREGFLTAFPDGPWEVRTFEDRSERIARRLDQLASAFLIIGLSTLFIGGLGVFNSIHAYLQGRLVTIATLRALGLRNRRLAAVYLLQVAILSGGSSLVGGVAGFALAMAGAAVVAAQLSLATAAASLAAPLAMALAFGLLTAFAFALPAIGRALSVSAADLFRDIAGAATATPRGWWLATLVTALVLAALVLLALPDTLLALGFMVVAAVVLGVLELMVRGLRRLALGLQDHPALGPRFALRLAMANLHRPGSPLRTSLLSLGSALTLVVVCALVVGALGRAINDTIPRTAPALVLYDVSSHQLPAVAAAIEDAAGAARVETAPLVLGRLSHVNGEALAASADTQRRQEARDEHKLSYRGANMDGVTIRRGAWWSGSAGGGARVVMEDREADQLGLEVGDRLRFAIAGQTLDAELVGIYSQQGMRTRFWFEALFSDGALDPFIHRHVGAAYMDPAAAVAAQGRVAAVAPNVVTVRTAALLETARHLLGRALAGLAVVAGVSLAVSLLVLTAVMATTRTRQVYDGAILHALGARLGVIRSSLRLEYLLLAGITSAFAVVVGGAIALPLLAYRLKLPAADLLWLGAVTALAVSGLSLALGARVLLRRSGLSPAVLLRSGG